MGTINYGSNDFINIGINPDNYWIDNDFLDFEIESDYYEIKHIFNKYNFDYFTVTLESGYYEGFYIDIKFDYLYLDSYEKPLILKELTQLKLFLLECCDYGMVKYSPGWCMGYSDRESTIKAIKSTIRETKENIKKYPTWKNFRIGA
jgi:hypothetical protein